MELLLADFKEVEVAIKIIHEAKVDLKEQEINQWQNGYSNYKTIENDSLTKKWHFLVSKGEFMKYTKLTKENYSEMIKSYINAFNSKPNNDEWTEESAIRKWS